MNIPFIALDLFLFYARVCVHDTNRCLLFAVVLICLMYIICSVSGQPYNGLQYEKGNCGVSIMRSGKSFNLVYIYTCISWGEGVGGIEIASVSMLLFACQVFIVYFLREWDTFF